MASPLPLPPLHGPLNPPEGPSPAPTAPAATAFLRLQGVRKSYERGSPVVRDLTLDIARGEFLTLLGPSGSGKTTTLMMLAGFEQPDQGDILLEGRSIALLPAHRRGIGMVFQSLALFPHMSVARNIAFPLAVRHVGRAERDRLVGRALDMVRLAGLEHRMPGQLSGGQQQRVALARALVFEPKLVLMDEPLGALDRQLREEMQLEIRALHARLGITMVYVTHDQAEAMTMSDRIALFASGVVQQLGPPQTLYDQPASAFVARFLGENNRLPGRVIEIDGDMATVRLACGPVVEARRVDAGAAGAECIVSIRPERIAVAAVPAEEMGEGAIGARLIEAIHLGDHIRLRLAIGDAAGAEIVVKRPAGAAIAGLVVGAPAAVAWQPHHALAFRPEPT
jgi:putative spermidine/putrescine transport system ATP-binding protein